MGEPAAWPQQGEPSPEPRLTAYPVRIHLKVEVTVICVTTRKLSYLHNINSLWLNISTQSWVCHLPAPACCLQSHMDVIWLDLHLPLLSPLCLLEAVVIWLWVRGDRDACCFKNTFFKKDQVHKKYTYVMFIYKWKYVALTVTHYTGFTANTSVAQSCLASERSF